MARQTYRKEIDLLEASVEKGRIGLISWSEGMKNAIKNTVQYVTSVRKTVSGQGNMKKEQMEEYVKENYPNFKYKNLDEMDSFVLGMAYFKQMGIL